MNPLAATRLLRVFHPLSLGFAIGDHDMPSHPETHARNGAESQATEEDVGGLDGNGLAFSGYSMKIKVV